MHSMLQLVKGLILTIALGLSATESIVSARTAIQKTEHEPALKTVLIVTFAFSAADSSDDVTEDMLNSICAHVKKHAAFEANIDLEDDLECQHSVYGLPVQVQTLLQVPSVQNESEGNWMDHLASLIEMEIENDGSFLDIGDVSPVDIKAERSAGSLSEKRQLHQVADAPTSDTGMDIAPKSVAPPPPDGTGMDIAPKSVTPPPESQDADDNGNGGEEGTYGDEGNEGECDPNANYGSSGDEGNCGSYGNEGHEGNDGSEEDEGQDDPNGNYGDAGNEGNYGMYT